MCVLGHQVLRLAGQRPALGEGATAVTMAVPLAPVIPCENTPSPGMCYCQSGAAHMLLPASQVSDFSLTIMFTATTKAKATTTKAKALNRKKQMSYHT